MTEPNLKKGGQACMQDAPAEVLADGRAPVQEKSHEHSGACPWHVSMRNFSVP